MSSDNPRFFRHLIGGIPFFSRSEPATENNQHVLQALAENKREGLVLAVRARWVALAITAVLLAMTTRSFDVVYYYAILLGLALIGWLQLRAGTVGRSRWELMLIFFDILLMVIGMLLPNPLLENEWPTATQYKFDNFKYFYIFMAANMLGYSWRTVFAYGIWTVGLWIIGLLTIVLLGTSDPTLTDRLSQAVNGDIRLLSLLDPSNVQVFVRIEEVAVFLIVATILAINSYRMNRLLLRQANSDRERTNLARYFSPRMVEHLAEKDHPLDEVRAQNVAVMFADIVGFSRLAEKETPEKVISLLRSFHRLIEETVFEHGGTLDKFLGDGAMVTFGTPVAGSHDAGNALLCADDLLGKMSQWNAMRQANGDTPIQLSLGVHYGPVILGDIGSERRLEFATLGDSVNVASRLEELTRSMQCDCLLSDQLVTAVRREGGHATTLLQEYEQHSEALILRGREGGITVWCHKTCN